MSLTKKQRRSRVARRGTAVTELAVCLPVIVLIVIATIEAATMIFLQQSLAIAAYESARIALVPGAEASDVQKQSDLLLASRGVKLGRTTVTPASLSAAPAGSWIQVSVTAPFKPNSFVGGWLFAKNNLQAVVEMVKER